MATKRSTKTSTPSTLASTQALFEAMRSRLCSHPDVIVEPLQEAAPMSAAALAAFEKQHEVSLPPELREILAQSGEIGVRWRSKAISEHGLALVGGFRLRLPEPHALATDDDFPEYAGVFRFLDGDIPERGWAYRRKGKKTELLFDDALEAELVASDLSLAELLAERIGWYGLSPMGREFKVKGGLRDLDKILATVARRGPDTSSIEGTIEALKKAPLDEGIRYVRPLVASRDPAAAAALADFATRALKKGIFDADEALAGLWLVDPRLAVGIALELPPIKRKVLKESVETIAAAILFADGPQKQRAAARKRITGTIPYSAPVVSTVAHALLRHGDFDAAAKAAQWFYDNIVDSPGQLIEGARLAELFASHGRPEALRSLAAVVRTLAQTYEGQVYDFGTELGLDPDDVAGALSALAQRLAAGTASRDLSIHWPRAE